MKKIIVILVMALALVPGAVFCEQANGIKQAEDLNSSTIIALNLFSQKKNKINPIVNTIGMRFNYIKLGTFQMGSSRGSIDEVPVHEVTISKGFYMQISKVTKLQWYSVMKDSPWVDEDNVMESPRSPAEFVSWEDVQIFIGKLNQLTSRKYRLPTEAEWEYACRAGSTTGYSFGNGKNINRYVWYDKNTYYDGKKYAQLVGHKEPNAWGLYDMHGNVWEWCQDRFGGYSLEPVTDPKGPALGHYRVLRSGSWDSPADHCRSGYRSNALPDKRITGHGFRLVTENDK